MFGMLGAKPGERILDLGCGDGALTAEIKALGAHVLGVDLSDELLAVARMKGLNVRKVDGHALDFVSEFDAVFSNAALHWMRKPNLVIAGVARALRPRGRFVGELGGHGNVAAIATAMRAVGAARGGDPRYGRAVVLPHRRGIWRAPGRGRLQRQRDRARAAPDAAQDRHGRLAADLRPVLLRSVPRAGADQGRGRGRRAAAALAMRQSWRVDRRSHSASLRMPSAVPDGRCHTNAPFMVEAFDA